MRAELAVLSDAEREDYQLPCGERSQVIHTETPGSQDRSLSIVTDVDIPYAGDPPYSFETLINRRRQFRPIRYRRHGDQTGQLSLPPPDAWLIDPHGDKLETPVDERGLVKQDELVDMVYGIIDPSFHWPRELSVDHVYHDEEWYYSIWAPECGGHFRELPIHKMLVRRMWENVKHRVVIPPAVPSEEVMRNRLESWAVASSLLRSMRNSERIRHYALSRFVEYGGDASEFTDEFIGLDDVTQEWALETLERHLRATERSIEKLERIPPEFRLVHPETPRGEMAERLAKLVAAEALYMVNKIPA